MDIHVQSLHFDNNTKDVDSQTNIHSSWQLGLQGGSYLMNERAREMIMPQLHNLAGDALEGEVAYIMQHFKIQKRLIKYTRHKRTVVFTGTYPHISANLIPVQIFKASYAAFNLALALLKAKLGKVLAFKRDIVFLSTGGSWCQPGMACKANTIFNWAKRKAREYGCFFWCGTM